MNVLHVVTAVFLAGPMAILPMLGLRALRTGDGPGAQALARSTNIFGWASLLVVFFGFGALGMSDPKYDLSVTTGWILASILCYVVALLLTLVVIVPAMRAAATHTATHTGSAGDGSRAPGYARIAASSGVMSLLLVAVVVLMVWKP